MHEYRPLHGISLLQIRSAMAVDLLMVTICVIHDPNPIPPAALAFLMVLLGNGMRYGMRLFAEVLGGALLGMALSFAIRYRFGGFETSAGDVFTFVPAPRAVSAPTRSGIEPRGSCRRRSSGTRSPT